MKPGYPNTFRIVAIAVLAVGLFLTVGGTAAGMSALSGPGGNAAGAVYPPPPPPGPPITDTGVPPQTPEPEAEDEEGDVLGDRGTEKDEEADLEPARQVTATGKSGSDSLPFTGFLAIGLLLAGVVMLLAGTGLLRRLRPR